MRQRTHLVSHYSEASSRITGPRRLDGAVAGQDGQRPVEVAVLLLALRLGGGLGGAGSSLT